jgi:hypothetical protein
MKNSEAAELKDLMAKEGNNLKLMWVPKEMKKLTRLQRNLSNRSRDHSSRKRMFEIRQSA